MTTENLTMERLDQITHLAKEAYKGYGQTTDFKNYQGLPMPRWEDLTPKIRLAWFNAVKTVLDLEAQCQR